jgi:hypothetical protein
MAMDITVNRVTLTPYLDHYRSIGANIEVHPNAWYDQRGVVVSLRLWRWETSLVIILP